MKKTGVLYLVAVPIGHDRDITLRALDVLKEADFIAAEDTRKAQRLLKFHGISDKKMFSHHEHNELSSSDGLIEKMREGAMVAFMSDAGMPGISDPGFVLARAARAAGVPVEIVSGVSAVTTALLASNLPPQPFTFHGFVPRGTGERRKFLTHLLAQPGTHPGTHLMFESARRVAETLANLATIAPQREVALCRELTKIHEEILRGTAAELAEQVASGDLKGEIVLVIAPPSEVEEQVQQEEQKANLEGRIRALHGEGLSPRAIRDRLAEETKISKKEIYNQIIKIID